MTKMESDLTPINSWKDSYNEGLLVLYQNITDFYTLCDFLQAFNASHDLSSSSSDPVGVVMDNVDFSDPDAWRKGVIFDDIVAEEDTIWICYPSYTLKYQEEDILRAEAAGIVDEQAFSLRIQLKKENRFLFLLLDFQE